MFDDAKRSVNSIFSSWALLTLMDLMVCMIISSVSRLIAHSRMPALMVGWRRMSLAGISPSGAFSDRRARDGMVDGLRSNQLSIAQTLTKSLNESVGLVPRIAARTLSCSLKE